MVKPLAEQLAERKAQRLRKMQPSKQIAFLKSLLGTKTTDCINWPFAKDRDGYGRVGKEPAHRVMLVLKSKIRDNPRDAAHSCGNTSCVNPNHLSWKSRANNNKDKKRHGTWGRKLTEQLVREIRASADTDTELSRRLEIPRSTISEARKGVTWSWVV